MNVSSWELITFRMALILVRQHSTAFIPNVKYNNNNNNNNNDEMDRLFFLCPNHRLSLSV
jgi:hypothetical protein